jgi:hypothetical protein
MLTAEAHIGTDRPSRYLNQLCQHANDMVGQRGHTRPARQRGTAGHGAEMRDTEWTDSHGIIRMSWGECTLRATPGTLTLRAEAADEENLRRIQDLVASRLERFGRRDQLTVTWQQARKAG